MRKNDTFKPGDFISYEVEGCRYFGLLKEVYENHAGDYMVLVEPNAFEAPSVASLSTVRKH